VKANGLIQSRGYRRTGPLSKVKQHLEKLVRSFARGSLLAASQEKEKELVTGYGAR
jgi:hypothetical protein